MKLFLWPEFSGTDEGDGGIRRVVEAQKKSLPRLRIQFVDDPGDADVIACHATIPDQFVRKFPDKPMVNHTHGLYWKEYEWMDWSYKANREVLKAICTADVTTAPTEWVAQIVRRHTSRDVRVIPHSVSAREWQPLAENNGYVLWNKTRIDPVCEMDSLNALVRKMPNTQFVSTFGTQAPNIRLTGRLSFAKAKLLVQHAAVYLCTVRETFGIGTLEAMSSGVPVVGFNFGGQAEIIDHGTDGWLAEPGDIDELARGVEWALANREQIGIAARKKVSEKYSSAIVAQMYADLYKEVFEAHEEQDKAPRVSIIVPAYNLEKYLPDTLNSIASQADEDWECIVVDDASPDRCGAIADAMAATNPKFRVIHNEKNLYLAEARNIGIAQAKGRYILPVDADDMLTPHAVRMLADALDADRSLQVAYGNVFFTEEDGKTPVDYHVPSQSPGHSGWPMHSDPWKQVQGFNLLPYSSMFRKSAWQQVGGYRRRLKTSEDADFWTRLASFGYRMQLVASADTLIYRNREGSMSRENGTKRHDYMRWFPWAKSAGLAPAGLAGDHNVGLLVPHVAVVIPVGPAHVKHVQDAVDSVMGQSYPYWECIVVNDSGQDLHLPSWARVLQCDARDVGAARNIGIRHAQSKLYLPLDADDYLQPDALQWLVEAHVETRGHIIYPDFYEDPKNEGEFTPYKLPDWSCALLTGQKPKMIHSVTALTPVAAWEGVGGYTEGLQWEDWDFQLKCAAAGFCTTRIAAPLFTYRKWTGTRRNWKTKEEFDTRLQGIHSIWHEYFQGGKPFMACSCQGKTISPKLSAPNGNGGAAASGDAVMVEYTGARLGSVRYKGPGTGAIYSFAAKEGPKWVAAQDVQLFARHSEFRVVEDQSSGAVSKVPVLNA